MFGDAFKAFFVMFFVMIPISVLGIWKIVDIIVWLFTNISVTIKQRREHMETNDEYLDYIKDEEKQDDQL